MAPLKIALRLQRVRKSLVEVPTSEQGVLKAWTDLEGLYIDDGLARDNLKPGQWLESLDSDLAGETLALCERTIDNDALYDTDAGGQSVCTAMRCLTRLHSYYGAYTRSRYHGATNAAMKRIVREHQSLIVKWWSRNKLLVYKWTNDKNLSSYCSGIVWCIREMSETFR